MAYALTHPNPLSLPLLAVMAARGIDAGRVSAEGRGEKQPVADNATEAGRSLNRRVEIASRD